jgi:hypothetical protein
MNTDFYQKTATFLSYLLKISFVKTIIGNDVNISGKKFIHFSI